MEYYSAVKKNEIVPFAATWMDLEIIILSEVKQDRERQILHDITYRWNLKYDTNELIYEIETDIEKRLVVAKGEDGWRGWIWSLGLADVNYYIENG